MEAVFEVNRQMCDLEIDRKKWDKIGKEWDSKKKEIVESIFKGNDMEKKKMTKAEAFEWLKNKKVYVDGNSAVIQAKLFEAGIEWPENKRHISNLEQPFLILSEDGGIYYSNNMCHYLERSHEEISAEDILSIEIVEGTPEFRFEKVVELAKPLMEYLNDTGCTDQIGVSYDHIVAQPMATFLHGEMKGC